MRCDSALTRFAQSWQWRDFHVEIAQRDIDRIRRKVLLVPIGEKSSGWVNVGPTIFGGKHEKL